MKDFMKKHSLTIFFISYIVYCELIYKIFTDTFSLSNIIYPVLFSIITGIFIGTICGLLPAKASKAISIICLFIIVIPFLVQIVYSDWFKTAVTVKSALAGLGKVVDSFGGMIITAISGRILPVLLFVLPIPVYIIFVKKFDHNRKSPFEVIKGTVATVVILVVTMCSMFLWGTDSYTPFDLYVNISSLDTAIAKLGVTTATRIDIRRAIFDTDATLIVEDESIVLESDVPAIEETTEELSIVDEPVYEANMLDIDFDALITSEENEDIIELHNYFSNKAPTYKNEYTGMFEGYNLVMLTCEGFSPMAVDKELTPTLYKLTNNGFVFNNFYTPIWGVSTSDGEYVACTGQYPKSGVWSFARSADNNMKYCLGNVFGAAGYSTYAYHNHDYTYYDRHLSHPNMGYNYIGNGNGLEVTSQWPESDLEMIENTIDDYINDDKFHAYYMTVSGHLEYNFFGNAMAAKHKDAVAELEMSDQCKAYIACQIELDKALEYLIGRLEEANKLDNTVIILSADHYPYGLSNESIAEFLGHSPELNFELYKNNFVVWNSAMEETVTVDKYSSSIDILPTVLNLFGYEYDSRLLAGTDLLSDTQPIVAFNNGSFITDKCMYNSQTGEVTLLTDEQVTDEYIDAVRNIVVNKFRVSAQMLDTDYYSYIE